MAAEPPDLIAEVEEQIDAMRVKAASITSTIEEILDQTRNADESEVRRLQSDYDRAVRDMTLTSQGAIKEERGLNETTLRLQKVQDDLKKHGTPRDLAKHRKHERTNPGPSRNYLPPVLTPIGKDCGQSETDATDLFLQLTTEEEYSRLTINENYGLEIVHKKRLADTVFDRLGRTYSALSLMGALQKNGPCKGRSSWIRRSAV